MAKLITTVFLKDPDRQRTIILNPGEEPAPHLAALITNPDCWEDGKLPDAAQDADSGDGSDPSADADPEPSPEPVPGNGDDEDTKPAARKTTARKTAARKPAAD